MTIESVEYALMAGAAYISNRAGVNQIPVPEGWTEFFHVPNNPAYPMFTGNSGFEAVSFQKRSDPNEIVISFAGTDFSQGWISIFNSDFWHGNITLVTGVSINGADQLIDAVEYYLQVKATNAGAHITLTGHSLGGALAALVGVFFGESAYTFDQVPGAATAMSGPANQLYNELLNRGHTAAELAPLYDYMQLQQANGGIPHEELIHNINVQGEVAGELPGSRIGSDLSIHNNSPYVGATDLHSIALLTAMQQSGDTPQSTSSDHTLGQVTYKLTDLMKMIFDTSLFATDPLNKDQPSENFLERLVKNEAGVQGAVEANGMVTRFTSDLWKLAQDGGLTLNDQNSADPTSHDLSNALVAFAMQFYDESTANATDINKQLFTDLAASAQGNNGVRFDMHDVSKDIAAAMDTGQHVDLGQGKGYKYFEAYLSQWNNGLTDEEKKLIKGLLPTMRDWYVQAGSSGMIATQSLNHNTFMLGGNDADILTGGSGSDLLVGNKGDDILTGGEGNDNLLGGSGNDVYIFNDDFGLDAITDSNGQGTVVIDGHAVIDATQVFQDIYKNGSTGYTITRLDGGTALVLSKDNDPNRIIINDWSASNKLGIDLTDGLPMPPSVTLAGDFKKLVDDHGTTDTSDDTYIVEGANYVNDGPESNAKDLLYGGTGNDVIDGGGGDDFITGDEGDDYLTGGSGGDLIQGGTGSDTIMGGGGDDTLYASTKISQNKLIDVNYVIPSSPYQNTQGAGLNWYSGYDNTYSNGVEADGDITTYDGTFIDDYGGDSASNYIDGGNGNDFISGGNGADYLIGGADNDKIDGLGGDDIILGGDDNDYIHGDFSSGTGDGNDIIDGGDGQDSLFGDGGDDIIFGGGNDDTIYGGLGNDYLVGGSSNDVISGDDGNDTLIGGTGQDTLYGGVGDDVLISSGDGDLMYGGAGADTFYVGNGDTYGAQDSADKIYFMAGGNADGVSISLNPEIGSGGGGVTLDFGDAIINMTNGVVAAEDSTITFSDGTTIKQSDLIGAKLGDVVNISSGSNALFGGMMGDYLEATGTGNATLFGGLGGDTLVGNDGNNNLRGGAGDDTLSGGLGDDVLDGSDGNDVLIGGAGVDVFYAGAGDLITDQENEIIHVSGIGSADSVTAMANGALGTTAISINLGSEEKLDILNGTVALGDATYMFDDGSSIKHSDLLGGSLNSFVNLQADTPMLFGGALNDTLTASGYDDHTLFGGLGDDSLTGGAGADTIVGGGGNDFIAASDGVDRYIFSVGDGKDVIYSAFDPPVSSDTIRFSDVNSTDVAGLTYGTLQYNGVNFSGLMINYGADDSILFQYDATRAKAVDQFVFADDTSLTAQQLFDSYAVQLTDADESITFNNYDTDYYDLTIKGGGGNDSIGAVYGNNSLYGEGGDDYLYAYNGDNLLSGGAGNDSLRLHSTYPAAPIGNATLVGGVGNDSLTGNGANSEYIFSKGDGNDLVYGNWTTASNVQEITFADVLSSDVAARRVGNDLILNYGSIDRITVANQFVTDQDVDQFSFSDNVIWNAADVANLLSSNVQGSSGNDSLVGTSGSDVIYGNGGNDTLVGAIGNDILDGGTGNDSLIGGIGDDTYVVDSAGDAVVENAGEGIDLVEAALSYTLGANVEHLILSGSASINGTGNSLDNELIGNSGNNVLDGGAGADTLQGGDGNDTYIVDDTSDVVYEINNQGNDIIQSSVTIITLSANVEDLTLTGAADLNGAGNNLNNVITGNAGNNALDGGAGSDTLIGGLGDDIYTLDSLYDVVVENPGEGIDTLQINRSYSLASLPNIENLTLLEGALAPVGTGNNGDNILIGNSGANTLDGGVGVDTLVGGLGDDIYIVDNVSDIVIEAATGGTDTVQSSVSIAGLAENVENLTLTGSSNLNGTGNALANTITGNSGDNLLDGGTGNDTMIGGLGNDTYIVDSTSDVVTEGASAGTDTILSSVTITGLAANAENLVLTGAADINGTGNTLANTITGNIGNNSLDGGSGIDTLTGGAGDDIYLVDTTTDIIIENVNEGVDTIQSSVTFTLANLTNVENLTLTGTSAINATGDATNNVLTGNSGANTLNGGAGADTMIGGSGNDIYVVDDANDVVIEAASAGTDTIQSSINITVLADNVESLTLTGSSNLNGAGNALANTITGNSGDNLLDGGTGNDTMIGGLGNDTYVVDSASDVVTEGASAGTDTIQSSVTITSLATNVENLVLIGAGNINGTGNTLANTITGNAGNNILNGSSGIDTLAGGAGDDIYVVDTTTDIIIENVNEGVDTVQSSVTFTLANLTNIENLTLTGTSAINATGDATNNVLTGNSGANTLNGGAGADTMIGGSGNDIYVVDDANDVVIEAASSGTDTMQSSIDITMLADNVEKLTLTGSSNLNGTGNALANTITGNSGDNLLDGGTGNDTMIGGLGNDTYIVDSASDVVTEGASAGTDTIQSSVTITSLATNVENLVLTGTGNINGTGNTLANTITGNSGNNVLNGSSGVDTLFGGLGDDTYVVDNTSDVIVENGNEGNDTVQSSVTYTLASNVENLTLTGSSTINGTGNGLDNYLTGNSAVNTLTGGLGDDTLSGGVGADSLVGGEGNDTYVVDNASDHVVENSGEGTDTVQSSVTFTLSANVENLVLTGSSAINGTGNTLDNVLTGNSGANTLTGGAGNDTYMFGRGMGADTVVENDSTTGNADLALFGSDIAPDQIWFQHVGNNLDVSIIGTSDHVVVQNWYLGDQYHVEQLKTSDNHLLLDSQVENLVSAMAAFTPPPPGQMTLTPEQHSALDGVIAANWQAA